MLQILLDNQKCLIDEIIDVNFCNNNFNKEDFSYKLRQICIQLNSHINHSSRLEIIHFLFGVSHADNEIHPKEVEAIKKIATYMNINPYDFESIKSMFLVSDSFSKDNFQPPFASKLFLSWVNLNFSKI